MDEVNRDFWDVIFFSDVYYIGLVTCKPEKTSYNDFIIHSIKVLGISMLQNQSSWAVQL